MNIFLDTSALVAWFNQDDKYHQDAQKVLKDIQKDQLRLTRFIITDYIIDETLTFFETTIKNHELAEKIGEALLKSGYIHLEHIDPETFEQTWERFKQSTGFSFTDCSSMTMMDKLGIRTAFSFDEHFKMAGYNLLP